MEEETSVEKEYTAVEPEIVRNIETTEIYGLTEYYKEEEEVYTGKINHDGKKIYRYTIGNFGALPTSTTKYHDLTGVSAFSELVSLTATYAQGGAIWINRNAGGGGVNIIDWYVVSGNPYQVACATDFDASNRTAQTIVVEYTRTDK